MLRKALQVAMLGSVSGCVISRSCFEVGRTQCFPELRYRFQVCVCMGPCVLPSLCQMGSTSQLRTILRSLRSFQYFLHQISLSLFESSIQLVRVGRGLRSGTWDGIAFAPAIRSMTGFVQLAIVCRRPYILCQSFA